LFVIAPDKRTIYPENLPRYQPRPGRTRREQLDAAMAGQDDFLDPTQTLRDRKARSQVYYRWDTHWDRHGAYEGYRAVMQRLGLPAEPEFLGHAPEYEDHVGDLGRLSGLTLTEPDRAPASRCAVHVPPPEVSLRPDPALKGERDFEVRPTTCAQGTGRLLMFHDSFGGMWAPWLSTQFASAVYVWRQPSLEDIQRMVEAVHPTVVIEERVERFLVLPVRR
jgi:alginate O-acetyltransferase complex protein AlgJ